MGKRGKATSRSGREKPKRCLVTLPSLARCSVRGSLGVIGIPPSDHLHRPAAGVHAHRLAQLWWAGRSDRVDAPRTGGRTRMDQRGRLPPRAQLLPPAARPRSAAARHMDRLAIARLARRAGGGVAVRDPRRTDHSGAVGALCHRGQSCMGRGAIPRRESGGAGDCGAGAAADCGPCARHRIEARAGCGGVYRAVPVRSAVPADRAGFRRDRHGGGGKTA